MNIFAASKTLGFVAKLFAAAKLNLDDFVAAGDETALAAHIEAQRPSAAAVPAVLPAGALDVEAAQKLNAEIASLKSQIANLESAHATATAQLAAIRAAKIDFAADAKPEAVTAALTARISMAAGEELAKRGLREFPEQQINPDPTQPAAAAAADPKLTGRARLRADFNRQLARLNTRN